MVQGNDSPVDVTELMFTHAVLERHGDVKGPAGRDGSTHARHGDAVDVVEGDVGRRFRHEHEALVEAIQ